jgi:hypothetical protein
MANTSKKALAQMSSAKVEVRKLHEQHTRAGGE